MILRVAPFDILTIFAIYLGSSFSHHLECHDLDDLYELYDYFASILF